MTGATFEIIGFATMIMAIQQESSGLLYLALGIVVTGFSFLQPSLNSMLSRRSDPTQQGTIMGVGQSVSSLARIVGSGIGIPLLTIQLNMPYYVATGLMILGVLLIVLTSKRGKDFDVTEAGTAANE
jgi:predicted MFS family arabinose efflux permease